MLFCVELIAFLLYSTVVANAVCSYTYANKDIINASSLVYQRQGYEDCRYAIHAPRDSYIELNFTELFGFQSNQGEKSGNDMMAEVNDSVEDFMPCIPPQLLIKDIIKPGENETVQSICTNKNNNIAPQVFHSESSTIMITFIWGLHLESGFSLDFDFHKKNNCAFYCDDKCFEDSKLVCDNVNDCQDKLDEKNCPTVGVLPATFRRVSDAVVIFVIVTVVLVPGVLIAVMVTKPWRQTLQICPRQDENRHESEQSQLQQPARGSMVVYVPNSTTSVESDQEIGLLRERNQHLSQSLNNDSYLVLPPQIPVSLDGEEGYRESQLKLVYSNRPYQDLFQPPPNRTIYDKESPPPYDSYFSDSSFESLT